MPGHSRISGVSVCTNSLSPSQPAPVISQLCLLGAPALIQSLNRTMAKPSRLARVAQAARDAGDMDVV